SDRNQSRPSGPWQKSQDITQAGHETVSMYLSRMEEFLDFVDVEHNQDLVEDSFFTGMWPGLRTQASMLRHEKLSWSKLVQKVIQM
ncbi:hypothetical protein DSO57_1005266, partial [Entomophthora muscae]